MALYMSLVATMAVSITLAACNFDKDDDNNTPSAADYININITRCERVGSVLQMDFEVTNKNNADLVVRLGQPYVTDNNGTKYGYGNTHISTGSNGYSTSTSITITGKNTIKAHVKVTDFDPLNTAKNIKLEIDGSITNINCETSTFTNSKIEITDNRVMAHGVQTNDTNLAWKVKSCTRNANGKLVLDFTLTNNTGSALDGVIIRYDEAFDNIGNKFGYGSMWVRWGNNGDYSSNVRTNIAAGGTIDGSILIEDFNANATEVTANIRISIENYIPSDDIVRFLTIPVTK